MEDAILNATFSERARHVIRRFVTRPPAALTSLADQGVVSAFGFLSGIAAARLLGIAEFGHFALVLIILAFAQALHNAVITAPMMTLAGQRGRASAAYAANIVAGAFLLSVVGAAFVVSALIISGERSIEALLAALALMLAQNLQFTLRRLLFVQDKGASALGMDLLRAASFPIAIGMAWLVFGPTGSVGFIWLLAATSFATTLPFLVGSAMPALHSANCLHLITVLRRHKPIARWLLPIVFVTFLQEQLVWILVGSHVGLDALGGLRAAQYLTGAVLILLSATENVLPVAAARAYAQGGETGLRSYLKGACLRLGAPIAAILIVLAVPAHFWLELIFGPEFGAYACCLQILAGSVAIIFVRDLMAHYFRAKANTSVIFVSLGCSAIATVAVVLPLANYAGVTGAAIAVSVGHLASLIYLAFALRGTRRPG